MKAVPLDSQNTVEFTASLPCSQHSSSPHLPDVWARGRDARFLSAHLASVLVHRYSFHQNAVLYRVRVSELVNMRLQEVDLERGQIHTQARSNSRPAIVSGQDRPIHIAGLVGGQEAITEASCSGLAIRAAGVCGSSAITFARPASCGAPPPSPIAVSTEPGHTALQRMPWSP